MATESTPLRVGEQDALIVVDVQNDFCPGGALAVNEGDQVVETLNELMPRFGTVVATQDWHPADHRSFAAHGGEWPEHCVAETPGAELHPELDQGPIDIRIRKATTSEAEAYSGFDGTDLAQLLRDRGIDRVTVAGLATDYCVKATALDALREGFGVTVDTVGSRGIDVEPGDVERALAEVRAAGGTVR